jgi:hypothetical protein
MLAKKRKLDINPRSSAKTYELVDRIGAASPELIKRVKMAIGHDESAGRIPRRCGPRRAALGQQPRQMSLRRRSRSRSRLSCAAAGGGCEDPISADTFPHATTSGPVALARRLPLLRHEAARSLENVASVRWGPQYAVSSTSSSRHSNVQSAPSQLVRTTRIAPPAPPWPGGPSGPCAP